MTLQEVQNLINAGFTHDEIMSFQQNPQDNPQPEPQPDYNALNETMKRLIKTIQASNLQNANRESIKVVDLNKQVDDIMKSIITGTKKKEE